MKRRQRLARPPSFTSKDTASHTPPFFFGGGGSLSPASPLFMRLLAEKSRLVSERNCPQVLVAETSFINEAHVSYLLSLLSFRNADSMHFLVALYNFPGGPQGKWNMYSICLSPRTSKGFSNINNFFKHESGNVAV